MSVEQLAEKIAEKPYWYHRIELPGGVTTPGWAPISPAWYDIPIDLTGRRVLDIGAWDGYWTFEALKRGAAEVVAIDDFSDYLGSLEGKDRRAWENFDLCRDAFGYGEDRCKRIEMNVYNLDPAAIGTFDVVFFFGTLYHLRYPLLALDMVSTVCSGDIFVESAVCDDYSPYRGGLGKGYPGTQMVMEFYPNSQYGNNNTNWWAPSLYCLMNMLIAAGFENVKGKKHVTEPKEVEHCRAFIKGKKKE